MTWIKVNTNSEAQRTIGTFAKDELAALPESLKNQLLTGNNELWSKVLNIIKAEPNPCDINYILIKFYKIHKKELKRVSVLRAIKLLKSRGLINVIQPGIYSRK